MRNDGDLVLKVGGKKVSGWQDVRITRGIERVPSDFELSATERYPNEDASVFAKPGDPCEVYIGDDVVITGYVDRLENTISATEHRVILRGRGKCQDLVDCAAQWTGGQIPTSTVLQICQKLAAPYKVNVKALVDTGNPIPMFALIHGESVFEIVDRICRYRGLLAYEDETGSLVLSHAGNEKAASGFELGKNVLEASAHFRMDESYSDYWVYAQAIDIFADKGGIPDTPVHIKDSSVPRPRVMALVAETNEGGLPIAKMRGTWERNRRRARQKFVTIKTDSWRDEAGKVWKPNTLAPVSLPTLKIDKVSWLVGEVTYRLGEEGTSCELTLMEPGAFIPAPSAPPDFNLIDVPGQRPL